MTKILAIGDVHFKVTNIPEVELFIDKITSYAITVSPDIIVILGDVLDTHEKIHAIPLNKAVAFFRKMKDIAYTYVLVGNHDLYNNQQFLSENHWMNSFKEWDGIKIVDKVTTCNYNGDTYTFCPYVPPGKFIEALDTSINWKDSRCIFAHQEFKGCKMGPIISIEGDIWDKEFPMVVSGHIHSKDKLQDNLYYTGSAMQHAFGESDKNVIVLITFTQDEYEYIETDLNLPRKKTVQSTIKNIGKYEVKNTVDKILISLEGNYEEFKTFKKTKKYRELISSGIKIKFNQHKLQGTLIQKETGDFIAILNTLIEKEKDSYLTSIYEYIVYNKHSNFEDNN